MAIQPDFCLHCRKPTTKTQQTNATREPLFRSSAAMQNAYPLHEYPSYFSLSVARNYSDTPRKKKTIAFSWVITKTKSFARYVGFRCAQIKLPFISQWELWCRQLLVLVLFEICNKHAHFHLECAHKRNSSDGLFTSGQ